MARRTQVSQSMVCRIISKKLERKRIKKKTIKRLAKRGDRAKGFAELVADEKAAFIFTRNEAMLPLNFKNGDTIHFLPAENVL